MGFLQHIGQRRPVDGGDDEDFDALGDHIFDLRNLVFHHILAILQVRSVAQLLEFLDHVVSVIDPAFRGFRRHGDADRSFFSAGAGFPGGPALRSASRPAAGG
ncbi:hypothetical protein D1872_251210 [compost metagenome]